MWNFTFHSIAGLIQQYILQLLRHTGHQQIALIVQNLKSQMQNLKANFAHFLLETFVYKTLKVEKLLYLQGLNRLSAWL